MSSLRTVTPARVVLAFGLLVLVGVSFMILTHRAPRRSGTNLTGSGAFVIPLGPGQQLCEGGELLPGDTGALEVGASANGAPGPALTASIADARGTISTGMVKEGWRSERVRIPVKTVSASTSGTVCLRNLGSHPVTFSGSTPDADFQIVLAGRPLNGRLRIEYLRPGSESWLQMLPTIAYRLSLAKSNLVRHWAAGGALVLMLLAVSLALRTTLKEERA